MPTTKPFEIPLDYPKMFGTFIHVLGGFWWVFLLCGIVWVVRMKLDGPRR